MPEPVLSKKIVRDLFQFYLDDCDDALESDGFLPGTDVTQPAAVQLFNDVLLWGIKTGFVRDDSLDQVTIPE